MSKTTKSEERRFGSFWVCPNCEGNPEFEHDAVMQHFKEVHGIDSKAKGKKSMLCHMDGDTWFSWDYEWEINGLKFLQHTCNKRSAEDAAYWN